MADRYPDRDYGRDGARGRFSRSERWSGDDDWRRGRRQSARSGSQNEDDEGDRRGAGAYGGGYGQDLSGNYSGGYDRYRNEAPGEGAYRDRDEWDRAYGSSYSQPRQHQGQGGHEGYRTQGFSGFGAYEEGGSLGQGRGMGDQGYERSNQDYGGYSGSFGQGGSFGASSGYGSEQSGSYLTRGGRTQWGGHSGRGPKNYTRSDERIREDVNDRLTDDPHLDASDIDVKVTSCDVTLTGTVDSRQAKRRAEDCAESVSGVKNVQNNLRVQMAGDNDPARSPMNAGKKKAGESDGSQKMQ